MDAFKTRLILMFTLVVALFLLPACKNFPVPNMSAEAVSVDVFSADDLAPIMQRCEGDFLPPTLVSPAYETIDPVGPYTFTWEDHCEALIYKIIVHRNPKETGPTYIFEDFTTTEEEFTTGPDLDPMTTYVWRLIVIPFDGESNYKASNWSLFTTGPICDSADLAAPILISPADGAVDHGKGWGDTTEVNTIMQWEPAALCTPDSFTVIVHDNPEFTGQNHNIGTPTIFSTGNPGSVRLIKDDTNSLMDCTTYFWRGWATSGPINGPFSEAFSFYTDFENNCLLSIDFSAHVDANCRRDPWINGNEVGILRKGETARMLGRDEHGFWGNFLLGNGLECWIHMSSVDHEPLGTYFDPMLMTLLEYTHKPEPAADEEDDGGGGDIVKGCWIPDYSNPMVVGKKCVSPCPYPRYASQVCKP